MLNPERFIPEIAFPPGLWLPSRFGFNALGHLDIIRWGLPWQSSG